MARSARVVSGQAGIASALNGLGDISDEAKAAVAVIDFLTALLPRRRFVLDGELQPLGAEGAGISLELSRGGGAEALITFWGKSFGLMPDPPLRSRPLTTTSNSPSRPPRGSTFGLPRRSTARIC